MDDDISTPEQRMQELTRSAEVMSKLAADRDAFAEAVEAFRAQDPGRFQAVLDRVGLLDSATWCVATCAPSTACSSAASCSGTWRAAATG